MVFSNHNIYIYSFILSPTKMYFYTFPSYFNLAACNWTVPYVDQTAYSQPVDDTNNQTIPKTPFSPTIISSPSTTVDQTLMEYAGANQNSKPSSKNKFESKDEDYKPDGTVTKKIKKTKQLENRNVVPNIIRLILSFIQKKGKSAQLVSKLMLKLSHGQEWSFKRFYLYQGMLRNKMNNYVNEETLTQLSKVYPQEYEVYPEQQQRFYNKITRVIIHYFLREEISCCVLTSKRMERSKKSDHLRSQRYIADKLRQLL